MGFVLVPTACGAPGEGPEMGCCACAPLSAADWSPDTPNNNCSIRIALSLTDGLWHWQAAHAFMPPRPQKQQYLEHKDQSVWVYSLASAHTLPDRPALLLTLVQRREKCAGAHER